MSGLGRRLRLLLRLEARVLVRGAEAVPAAEVEEVLEAVADPEVEAGVVVEANRLVRLLPQECPTGFSAALGK